MSVSNFFRDKFQLSSNIESFSDSEAKKTKWNCFLVLLMSALISGAGTGIFLSHFYKEKNRVQNNSLTKRSVSRKDLVSKENNLPKTGNSIKRTDSGKKEISVMGNEASPKNSAYLPLQFPKSTETEMIFFSGFNSQDNDYSKEIDLIKPSFSIIYGNNKLKFNREFWGSGSSKWDSWLKTLKNINDLKIFNETEKIAETYAEEAAKIIISKKHPENIVLCGHSLGSHLVIKTLEQLANNNVKIKQAILLGGTPNASNSNIAKASWALTEPLINVYDYDDVVLIGLSKMRSDSKKEEGNLSTTSVGINMLGCYSTLIINVKKSTGKHGLDDYAAKIGEWSNNCKEKDLKRNSK